MTDPTIRAAPPPAQDVQGLIERLRELWKRIEPGTDDPVLMVQISAAIASAAAALAAQAGEIERLRAHVTAMDNWDCESDGCMGNQSEAVNASGELFAKGFYAYKQRAEAAEAALARAQIELQSAHNERRYAETALSESEIVRSALKLIEVQLRAELAAAREDADGLRPDAERWRKYWEAMNDALRCDALAVQTDTSYITHNKSHGRPK